MEFYRDFLGLPVNPERPNDKLPYDGAWLMIGPEMVHLMELPNPDPTDAEFRPAHGGKGQAFLHRGEEPGAADGGAGGEGDAVHGEQERAAGHLLQGSGLQHAGGGGGAGVEGPRRPELQVEIEYR
jgi:hypothetical protein